MSEEQENLELEGDLLIDNYPNLKEIDLAGAKGITKITIENCPQVKKLNLYDNPVEAIVGLNSLTELRELNCGNTKIKEIDISKNTELKAISFHDNEQAIKIIGFENTIKKLRIWNGIDGIAFPWEQVLETDLRGIAKDLGIKEEEMNDKSVKQIKELIEKEIKELHEIKGRIRQIPRLLVGKPEEINNERLKELKKLNPGEINKLVEWLNELGIEGENKVEKIIEKFNELSNNQKPTELPGNWQEQLKQIPYLENKITSAENALKNQLGDNTIDLNNLADKLPGYRRNWINPQNITVDGQNTLKKNGYVPINDYQGWINPNDKNARQAAGLRTADEVNQELDRIAGELGLDNRENLTNDNLTNLRQAEAERKLARQVLQVNDLNELPRLLGGENLQTLLSRPTKEQQEQVVRETQQRKDEEYKDYINPADENKLKEAAKKAGFGFEQKDIDEAVKTEREKWENFIDPNDLEKAAKAAGWKYRKEELEEAVNSVRAEYDGFVNPTTYRVDWINPNELEEAAKEKGMVSAADYKKVSENQKPSDLPSDWRTQFARISGLENRLTTALNENQKLLKNQKPTDYDSIKDKLNKWENDLGGRNFEQVQNELNKVSELEKRPTNEDLSWAIEFERSRYRGYIAPNMLEKAKAAKEKGMFSKEEYEEAVREKNARPNISLDKWNNDYSKRPEQTDLDQLQTELNKVKGLKK